MIGLTIISSCTRTVIGGFSDSPAKTFRVYGRGFGALRKAYVDETRKQVRITFVTNSSAEAQIGQFTFNFKAASDLGWDAKWDGEKRVTIGFFDYGPGISSYDVKENKAPRRDFGAAVFVYDEKTRRFKNPEGLTRTIAP
jgi:hypothetical protein